MKNKFYALRSIYSISSTVMASFTNVLLIIALFSFTSRLTVSGSTIVSRKHFFNFNEKSFQLLFDEDSIENTTLSYLLCYDSLIKSTKVCKVVLENNSDDVYVDYVVYEDVCHFYVYPTLKNSEFGTDFKAIPFDEDKIIVGWIERDTKSSGSDALLTFRVIQLPDCSSNTVQINVDSGDAHNDDNRLDGFLAIVKIVTYDDGTYDVIFPSKKLCQDDFCRSTYNAKGKKVTGPVAWFSGIKYMYPKVYPMKPHSIAKGHLIVSGNSYTYTALLIPGNGQSNKELTIPHERSYIAEMFGSVDNGRIGICARTISGTFHCSQFDLEDNKNLLNVVLSFGFQTLYSGMYNLPGGGFLLVTVDTERVHGVIYHITKVDAQGQRYRSLKLKDFKCMDDHETRIVHSNVFKNNKDKYCLSLTCRRSQFKFDVYCFTDKALSVKFRSH